MKCLSRILCRSFMCKCRSFHRLSGNKKLKTPKVHLVARKTQTSWHQFCRRGWHEKKPHQKPVLLGWFKQLKIVTLSTFRPRWHMDWSHEKMSNLDTQRHTLRPRRVTEEQGQESIQLSPAGVRGHRVTQTTEKRDCEKQSCQSLREKGSKSRDRVGMHVNKRRGTNELRTEGMSHPSSQVFIFVSVNTWAVVFFLSHIIFLDL